MASVICSRCHNALRASAGYCKPCYNSWRREWRHANPDKELARRKRAKERDPERVKQYSRDYYYKHRDKSIAKSRRWNIANKEAFAAREAMRRAMQRAAMPWWADSAAIEKIYLEARIRTQATGVPHHVDHIVPLVSTFVCGLHVPANLRVIPAFDNHSKGNRTWPDKP